MNRMEWKFEQTRQYIWNRPTTKPKVIVWLNTRSFRQIVLAHKMVGTFTVLIRDTMTTIEVQRVIWGSCRCLCQSFLSLTHSVCVYVCLCKQDANVVFRLSGDIHNNDKDLSRDKLSHELNHQLPMNWWFTPHRVGKGDEAGWGRERESHNRESRAVNVWC